MPRPKNVGMSAEPLNSTSVVPLSGVIVGTEMVWFSTSRRPAGRFAEKVRCAASLMEVGPSAA